MSNVQIAGHTDGRKGASTQNTLAKESHVHTYRVWDSRDGTTTKKLAEKDGREARQPNNQHKEETNPPKRRDDGAKGQMEEGKLQFITIFEYLNIVLFPPPVEFVPPGRV